MRGARPTTLNQCFPKILLNVAMMRRRSSLSPSLDNHVIDLTHQKHETRVVYTVHNWDRAVIRWMINTDQVCSTCILKRWELSLIFPTLTAYWCFSTSRLHSDDSDGRPSTKWWNLFAWTKGDTPCDPRMEQRAFSEFEEPFCGELAPYTLIAVLWLIFF